MTYVLLGLGLLAFGALAVLLVTATVIALLDRRD